MNKYAFRKDNETYTLRDAVELYALGIAEDLMSVEKKETREIKQKCEILDSLSYALQATKSN